MKDRIRYYWNWLLAKRDNIVVAVCVGVLIGLIAFDLQRGPLDKDLLSSLEADCQGYLGQRAMLIYHERRFYCLPEKP
jgi:hypothetical protein